MEQSCRGLARINGATARIIHLKDRSIAMTANELITANPLRRLEKENGALLGPGSLGAILSPAGVGKTAFVVQIAIDAMLQKTAVLHISLGDSIDKITLWYRKLFQNLAHHYSISLADEIGQAILPWRFIMTFKIAAFSPPVLEERLADLKEQNIFYPSIVIIDGLNLDETSVPVIAELGELAQKRILSVWITANTHRDDNRLPDGIPARMAPAAGYFERIMELKPGEAEISVATLKNLQGDVGDTGLRLDPASMLIR